MKPKVKKIALLTMFSLVVGGSCILVLEGISSLMLAWMGSAESGIAEEAHVEYDPDLGWAHIPSREFRDLYGEGIHLTTNSQGFRGLRDYSAPVPEGVYRIVFLGDSFTLGYGVGDTETHAAVLENLSGRVEVVNMGQGGYGIDQCYLWYKRDGVQLETDALLFLVIRDDFYRMLHPTFARVYPKPVLAVENGELQVLNIPVPEGGPGSTSARARRMLRSTALHRILRADSPLRGGQQPQFAGADDLPFEEVAEEVFVELKKISAARDQEFAIVFLPDQVDLKQDLDGVFVAWLRGIADRIGVPLVDLSPHFRALSPSEREYHFLPNGHYSLMGNRLVARIILEQIRTLWPDVPR